MGNPRRDAFEYGVLVTLGTGMAAAYAFLIAYSNQRTPDGQRRKMPKVDLDEPVDLGKAWEDMKNVMGGMRWGQQSSFPSSNNPDVKNNSGIAGGGKSASSSGKQGDQPRR
ncbi:hypothetical protein ACHAXR_004679 [Thalassiosira sp. AJA248-18]